MRRAGTSLVLLALAATLGAGCAAAAPKTTEITEYYSVTGVTAEEIRDQLVKFTPHDALGEQGFVKTSWRVHVWPKRGGCHITTIEVKSDFRITLPKLNAEVTPELRESFDTYLAALRKHSDHHAELYRSGAQRVERLLLDYPAAPRCSDLKKQADAAARALMRDVQKENADYDKETEFGSKDGVRFDIAPPRPQPSPG